MLHSFLCFVFPLSPIQTTDLQTRQSETCNYHVYCICSNNESYKKKLIEKNQASVWERKGQYGEVWLSKREEKKNSEAVNKVVGIELH